MRRFLTRTLIALCAAASFPSRADSGNDVIVIYNTRMPESKAVADYYAERRHVPATQVFGFALPTREEISRKDFHESLEQPLAKALEQKKLWRMDKGTVNNGGQKQTVRKVVESKIRYAVLCYGVPVRIEKDFGLKEKGEEALVPELRRNEAAVDSELALLPLINADVLLAGPRSSPFYGVTNGAILHPTNGVLMVTRLDGPSAEIARGLVGKAIQAEVDGLWGRAYFDVRGMENPGYKMGDEWINNAAEVCRRMGFDVAVDEGAGTFPPEFPMSQIAFYCGWYAENVSGPFTRTNVEFMPGAFAYHLHSFSAAILRSATNRWVGPLLQRGATISMGSVDEPFLMGTPDVGTFCNRLIGGFSFGEAAYASQSVLSWQTTVVGDPLYRPFAVPPPQRHAELERTQSKFLEWSYERLVNLNLVQGKRPGEMAGFLEPLEITKQSAVLTEKLADIYLAQGKPSSALDTYEKALQRNPSPEQRVRLRLAIADRLSALSRYRDLYNNLRMLLDETPDYPARFTILRRLLDLAVQQLQDKEEITRCVQDMKKFGEEENARAETH